MLKQLNYFAGTVGDYPTIRPTQNGELWTKFRMVVNHERYIRETGEYEQVDSSWYDVICYGKLAENVHKSLMKGNKVVVVGRANMEEWTNKDGVKFISPKIMAEAIGPDLKYRQVQVMQPMKPQNHDADQTQQVSGNNGGGESSGYGALGEAPQTPANASGDPYANSSEAEQVPNPVGGNVPDDARDLTDDYDDDHDDDHDVDHGLVAAGSSHETF